MWLPKVLWLGIVVGATLTAEPLRARWGGGEGDGEGQWMQVLGVDAAGRVRLVPEGQPEGEALVPREEAKGLRFELPRDYERARRLALAGRHGEAALLLRRFVPALVPYTPVPESNAGAAVRLYLRSLVREEAWADALAMMLAIEPEHAGTELARESAELARGLQRAQRWDELRLLLEVWWVAAPTAESAESRRNALAMATDLRRGGQWEEAAVLYEKLRRGTEGAERRTLDLLLAYLDWHRGSDLGARALLEVMEAPPAAEDDGALYRLLRGRLNLAAGETRAALDELATALVAAGSTSEWRIELVAALALAYRENGDEAVAARITGDLQRQHPDSRWTAEASAGEQIL
ncbi:hypothetical protein [Actomonas aquatica]|uniref:Tetratricopeptide repeat protein n=1 Tax=Actomonas aquatica TaxID=2866162 RepID=A0ABZ1C4R7_9BACT|nr:hypothetical protein [Opitutus sp. WL0086]WRQ86584.1 hypothetical protein K1X11_017365 [Opitutus sp. WL0086]